MFEENKNKDLDQPIIMPLGDGTTPDLVSQPTERVSHAWRNWSLAAILVIALAGAGWWYFSKKNPLPAITPPPTTNEATEAIEGSEEPLLISFDTNNDGLLNDEEIEFFTAQGQTTVAQLLPAVILCLDERDELTKPISGELICDNSTILWPDLPADYTWFDYFESSASEGTWIYSIHSDTFPDIKCDQTGCIVIEYYNVGPDSDGDGLTDEEEMTIYNTNVFNPDTDGDGLYDNEEEFWQTDPNNPDTDGDGYLDGEEINNGYNPLGEGYFQPIYEVEDEVILDDLNYLVKHDDTAFFKYNYFDIPEVLASTPESELYKFPIIEGQFSTLDVVDQISNVAMTTMMYVKELPEFQNEYNELYGGYGGTAGDGGMGGKEINNYFIFSLGITWPNEESVCDFEQEESAFRNALITKQGDVYFIGAACVEYKNDPREIIVSKGVGYTLDPLMWE